ncbi:MAG TPA: RHS repeat-associated core domain-containing protein [Candidatus Solibacter sp.]|nr:RHS repeat-associated core domain-containing protein [Candidatus Solibacter sp.]
MNLSSLDPNRLPILGPDLSDLHASLFPRHLRILTPIHPKSCALISLHLPAHSTPPTPRRVSKSNGKLYWYGSGGEILAETNSSGTTLNEYIFFGGRRVAMLPAGGNPIYYAEDLLGSSRVITQNNGAVCYDADFDPFGGEHPYTNNCPSTNAYKFEGKERDTETGNDDFGARYYTSRFGRWLSADWSSIPVPVPYANLTNPQTLNLYAMVSDDPESFADLDGHDPDNEQGGTLPAGKCPGFLCWLKNVLFGDPHKTHPAPKGNDPVGPVLANMAVGVQNLLDRAAGRPDRQTSYYSARTPQQAKEMQQVSIALIFVPGVDADELLAQLAQGAKPFAEGKELQAVIDALYQDTDSLPGGTAGAVRAERTGIRVGGKIHTLKAGERANQLRKLVARGNLSSKDVALAKALIQDLTNALTGK